MNLVGSKEESKIKIPQYLSKLGKKQKNKIKLGKFGNFLHKTNFFSIFLFSFKFSRKYLEFSLSVYIRVLKIF